MNLTDQHVFSLLKDKITNHYLGICDCSEKHGWCYAGMWLGKIISSKQVMEDIA